MAQTYAGWGQDPVEWRMERMHSLLQTEGNDIPIVIYGHCDCGFVFSFPFLFPLPLSSSPLFLSPSASPFLTPPPLFFFFFFFFFSCDRTGEMFGSYALKYFGVTWEQISLKDQSVPGRNISCSNYRGMMWYCLSLKTMDPDNYGSLDCLTTYQPDCNYPYYKSGVEVIYIRFKYNIYIYIYT